MIPKIITREHVLEAIKDIRSEGVSKKREPTQFNLVHHGRLYPPKYTLSIAAKYASGEELPAAAFSGGDEAKAFLEGLGFEIEALRKDWIWTQIKSKPSFTTKYLNLSAEPPNPSSSSYKTYHRSTRDLESKSQLPKPKTRKRFWARFISGTGLID